MPETGEKQRLFLAVELSDEVRHGLAAHLRGAELPGKPVPPDNWHVTLRFFGWVYDEQRELLLHALDEADFGDPFRLGFEGLGAFPREKRATVLWLGVGQGAEQLSGAAAAGEEAAVRAGFFMEERPFHPHLTLSRIRPPEDVTALVAATTPFPLKQDVSEIVLYRSFLGGGKPARYEVTERFPLGG